MSGNGGSDDLDVFEPFFDADLTPAYRLTWPYSNPRYTTEWERFDNKSHVAKTSVEEGGLRCVSLVPFGVNLPPLSVVPLKRSARLVSADCPESGIYTISRRVEDHELCLAPS